LGWKPCPKRCKFGGGYKESAECDHVTCECKHQFCWACGVERQIPLEHDNRWHKPSCPYHTRPEDVQEAPKRRPKCPACQKMPEGQCCAFPAEDGYPQSYIPNRAKAKSEGNSEANSKPNSTKAGTVGLERLEVTDVQLTTNAVEFHILISLSNSEQHSVRKPYRELLAFFSFFEREVGFPIAQILPPEEDEHRLAEDQKSRGSVQGLLNCLIKYDSVLKTQRFRKFFDLQEYEQVSGQSAAAAAGLAAPDAAKGAAAAPEAAADPLGCLNQ